MKKNLKRVIVMFASLMMIIGFVGQPVLASAGETRAAICMSCNKGTLSSSKSYSDWVVTGEVKCSHHIYGYDMVYERTVITTTKCNVCGQGYTNTTTEQKTTCHGSDTP